MAKRCTTCNVEVVTQDHVTFKCPVCGAEIVRCDHCRARGNPWICPKCGFKGP